VKDDSTFPRDGKLFVQGLVVEEAHHIFDEILLHVGVEDDIRPRSTIDGFPELLGLGPAPVVENEDLVV
jgi:hypothetical protein